MNIRILTNFFSSLLGSYAPTRPPHILDDADYIINPNRLIVTEPLCYSDSLCDILNMFGFPVSNDDTPDDHEVLLPDAKIKKPNGRDAMQLRLIFTSSKQVVHISFLGPITDAHVLIKKPTNGTNYQIDCIAFYENGNVFDIPCGHDQGNLAVMMDVIIGLKKAIIGILSDPASSERDHELELSKDLKRALGRLQDVSRLPEPGLSYE